MPAAPSKSPTAPSSTVPPAKPSQQPTPAAAKPTNPAPTTTKPAPTQVKLEPVKVAGAGAIVPAATKAPTVLKPKTESKTSISTEATVEVPQSFAYMVLAGGIFSILTAIYLALSYFQLI
jgi:hypothetical protein